MTSSKVELLKVQVRWLTERDLDAVYDLEQKCSENPWGPMEFANILMHSNCVGIVVEYQSRLIGYLIYEAQEKSIDISNIAVLPQFRRKGVASQMVARLACSLVHGTRRELTLSVRESNLPAQLFFRSLGFKAISIKRANQEMTEDSYVMQYKHRSRVLPTELVMN